MHRFRGAARLALLAGVTALTACADDASSPPGASADIATSASSATGGGSDGSGGASGAGGEGGAFVYDGPPLPWPYTPFPEVPVPEDDPVTPEKAALGRMLFYDPILSGDRATGCVTCHSEQWGLSDGLPTSIGVHGEGPVGPGRTGPTSTTRNAPSL